MRLIHPSYRLGRFFLLFCYAFQRSSATLKHDEYCVNSCNAALTRLSFKGASVEDYYLTYCTEPVIVESQFACAAVYCSSKQIKAGFANLNSSCHYYGGYAYPSYESVITSSFDLNSVPRLTEASLSSTPPTTYDHAVIPDEPFFAAGSKTVSAFYGNYNSALNFGYSLYGFWGLVLLIGTINRAAQVVKHRYGRKVGANRTSKPNEIRTWIRRCLTVPATFGKHCQEPVAQFCTIPPRLETIILLLYIALNFVYCFPGYVLFHNNLYYPASFKLQLARYISDRAGIIAIANVPILWVFAARNDPFLWLTGWSFAAFNRFHRWVARVATILAIVHSIGYSIDTYYEGGDTASAYKELWSEQYWYCGAIATIMMSLMFVASAYWMRAKYYDLFLVTHIVFAIVFLVTLYYHVRIVGTEFFGYIWACTAIWVLDRLLRLARIVYSSVLPRFLKGVKATATYDRDADMIRLEVSTFLRNQGLTPGVFYFIYMPSELRGFESHPFTLCSWRRRSHPSTPSLVTDSPSFEKEVEAGVRSISDNSSTGELCHSFLIRPCEGFTRRLKNKIVAAQHEISLYQLTVLLEGPYGKQHNLSSYSDVLIIVGGSGITAAISHAHTLVPAGSTNVHIHWAVPQKKLADDVCDHELEALVGSPRLDLVVYLTSGDAISEADKSPDETRYAIRYGRPDIRAIMMEARQKCAQDLAVVDCGTRQMTDVCRSVAVDLLGEQGPALGYYPETMLW